MGGIIQPDATGMKVHERAEPVEEVPPFLMNHPSAGLIDVVHANGVSIGRAASRDGKSHMVTAVAVRAGHGDDTGLGLMAFVTPDEAEALGRSLIAQAELVRGL